MVTYIFRIMRMRVRMRMRIHGTLADNGLFAISASLALDPDSSFPL